ncbi:MAG: NAD(P)-dependent oxidoreductase [Lachnospiraceae bacterium]|nr:NAD(P)-dependent oxidoreductase [Lachnospiraceae bacterium]
MSVKICLSILERDEQFNRMEKELSEVATVDVVDLNVSSLSGYDIFIGKKLSKEVLLTADNLKAIFAYKTGVDDFPLDEIKNKGIILVKSHADAHFIAEYAIGLAISLVNRITEFDRKFRAGIWYDTEIPYWRSFFDMKIGLLGYGHIGKEVHNLLKPFDNIKVYTIDRGKDYTDIELVSSVEELCEKTDMLILSLPKTPETNEILNKKTFSLLKGKYIVNVGRSNAINQNDFFEALGGNLKMAKIHELEVEGKKDVHVILSEAERSNYLAGAAIDTWKTKPEKGNTDFYPFDKNNGMDFTIMDNIVLSPHQAMKVADGHKNYVEDITDKVKRYIAGEDIPDKVDLERGY